MVLGHTVVDASVNILPVILPLLADRFQLTYGQAGLAAALMNISSSVIQPGFGWLSDRWPTKWFIPVGIAWTGIFMATVGLMPNYPMLLGAVLLTGLGTAAFHPIASMAVAHASAGQRGLGMSFFSAGGNLGFAVGPVLAAWMLKGWGLPGTIWLVVPGVLMAVVAYAWRGQVTVAADARGNSQHQDTASMPWGRLSILCVLIGLRSWGYSGLIVFIPLLLHAQGVSLEVAGRALFIFLFFGALGGMAGGMLSDRVGRQPVVAFSLVVFPVLMTCALLVSGPLRWLFLASAGIMLMASFSVTVVYMQELLPQHLGLASGLSLGLAFGAGGVGVALSGFLADLIGLPMSIWVLVLLPGLAGVLGFCLSSPRDRHP
jgi:FSR family fosmidomycin resistance protein-like MFS transporter